jgi:hypothetical protein
MESLPVASHQLSLRQRFNNPISHGTGVMDSIVRDEPNLRISLNIDITYLAAGHGFLSKQNSDVDSFTILKLGKAFGNFQTIL